MAGRCPEAGRKPLSPLDWREKERKKRCHWSPGARFWQNWTTERRGVGATEGRRPLPEKPPRQKGQRTDAQILHQPGSHQSLLLAQTRGACTCSLRGGQLPTHTHSCDSKRDVSANRLRTGMTPRVSISPELLSLTPLSQGQREEKRESIEAPPAST